MDNLPTDSVYQQYAYTPSMLLHQYGSNVYLFADPVALLQLSQLGHPNTQNPRLSDLLRTLYGQLGHVALATVLPRQIINVPTRMLHSTKRGRWQGSVIANDGLIVCCAIARGGLLAAQTVFELLCDLLPPAQIRQDHISMNRVSNAQGQIIGVTTYGCKMGDGAAGGTVFIPDPMGASGVTMIDVVSVYKNHPKGSPKRIIALHLIVTPEYIQALQKVHPEVIVIALRLDRGLSDNAVLTSTLGANIAKEQGLNERQYIVPGAGGLGEILNHCEG